MPEPTSPWSRRSIGVGRARSSGCRRSRAPGPAVRSTARPTRALERLDAAPRGSAVVRRGVDRDDRRAVAAARPAPPDHPELEREQLVEGEAPERRVAVLERRRVVRRLERRGDPGQRLLAADGRPAGTRGRRGRRGRAPRASRPAGGRRSARPSAGRPARSARRGAPRRRRPSTAWNSGLSSVRSRPKRLSRPETTTSLPGMQPPLDEPPAEPGRLDRRRSRPRGVATVRWTRRRKVGSTRMSPDRRRAPRRRSPPPPRRGRRARSSRRSSYRRGRWNSRSRTSYQPRRTPARRSMAAAVSPAWCERGRQELDRVGGRGGAGRRPRPHPLLGGDEVPVVRLAAVADLDLRRPARPSPILRAIASVSARSAPSP